MSAVAFHFLLAVLVTWRVTHLFSKEDGPLDLIYLVRKKAGAGFFGSLLDCFYCVSVWVAFPLGMLEGNNWWERILYWWALSGAACLLEQATTANKNNDRNVPDYTED